MITSVLPCQRFNAIICARRFVSFAVAVLSLPLRADRPARFYLLIRLAFLDKVSQLRLRSNMFLVSPKALNFSYLLSFHMVSYGGTELSQRLLDG